MKQFQKIVEKIARENGTTPENVMRQMQRAIDQAYDSRNAGSATMWAGSPSGGENPPRGALVWRRARRIQGSPARKTNAPPAPGVSGSGGRIVIM